MQIEGTNYIHKKDGYTFLISISNTVLYGNFSQVFIAQNDKLISIPNIGNFGENLRLIINIIEAMTNEELDFAISSYNFANYFFNEQQGI